MVLIINTARIIFVDANEHAKSRIGFGNIWMNFTFIDTFANHIFSIRELIKKKERTKGRRKRIFNLSTYRYLVYLWKDAKISLYRKLNRKMCHAMNAVSNDASPFLLQFLTNSEKRSHSAEADEQKIAFRASRCVCGVCSQTLCMNETFIESQIAWKSSARETIRTKEIKMKMKMTQIVIILEWVFCM